VLIPKTHPRAESLHIREKLVHGFRKGLVVEEGLLAHGRGEMFDYFIGEKTSKTSHKAIKAAARSLQTPPARTCPWPDHAAVPARPAEPERSTAAPCKNSK